MTKQLSPAAQAVKNAVLALYADENVHQFGWQLDAPTVAASLRAAADQIAPDEPHPGESQFWDDEADWEWQNNQHFRKKLLAIANELETL